MSNLIRILLFALLESKFANWRMRGINFIGWKNTTGSNEGGWIGFVKGIRIQNFFMLEPFIKDVKI